MEDVITEKRLLNSRLIYSNIGTIDTVGTVGAIDTVGTVGAIDTVDYTVTVGTVGTIDTVDYTVTVGTVGSTGTFFSGDILGAFCRGELVSPLTLKPFVPSTSTCPTKRGFSEVKHIQTKTFSIYF
ncbi:hypothetical protein PVL30_000333 [Lodderomyces elongisporus]|uniref:uncharacterized protein n=1 Tax=Lodderomyces elongisporus TaxID=36914 RepID=UPI002925AEAA|nr:uncharacterized protein PVL30_000333 [Lodderomyces elongisporus]WLF76631.1 hypothetical protein PVL30_000333 [Lodderomyces elongisporus]